MQPCLHRDLDTPALLNLYLNFLEFTILFYYYFLLQNTLSLLSRQIIQQFLDELVWRERWGPTPAQAFDTMISHVASQTKLDSGFHH